MYICGFNKQMHLHLSSFIWNASQWFERSDLNQSRKRFEFGGLVFSRSDSCPTREMHEVSRCKQAQRECAGKGSLLSLPQLTCALSQAQQSFTSLINHMNRSNTALAGQKFVLAAAKKI